MTEGTQHSKIGDEFEAVRYLCVNCAKHKSQHSNLGYCQPEQLDPLRFQPLEQVLQKGKFKDFYDAILADERSPIPVVNFVAMQGHFNPQDRDKPNSQRTWRTILDASSTLTHHEILTQVLIDESGAETAVPTVNRVWYLRYDPETGETIALTKRQVAEEYVERHGNQLVNRKTAYIYDPDVAR